MVFKSKKRNIRKRGGCRQWFSKSKHAELKDDQKISAPELLDLKKKHLKRNSETVLSIASIAVITAFVVHYTDAFYVTWGSTPKRLIRNMYFVAQCLYYRKSMGYSSSSFIPCILLCMMSHTIISLSLGGTPDYFNDTTLLLEIIVSYGLVYYCPDDMLYSSYCSYPAIQLLIGICKAVYRTYGNLKIVQITSGNPVKMFLLVLVHLMTGSVLMCLLQSYTIKYTRKSKLFFRIFDEIVAMGISYLGASLLCCFFSKMAFDYYSQRKMVASLMITIVFCYYLFDVCFASLLLDLKNGIKTSKYATHTIVQYAVLVFLILVFLSNFPTLIVYSF